jgi:hypothetical protein
MSEHDLGADGPAALARLTRDAVFRGNVVARQVCEPLEEALERGQLTQAQYEAGRRLRAFLAASWPEDRVTARPLYASAPGDWDSEDHEYDEAMQWQRMGEAHANWRRAETLVGAEAWPWVRGICRGGAGRMDLVRRGLSALAAEWGT